jgi:hypothetical protein
MTGPVPQPERWADPDPRAPQSDPQPDPQPDPQTPQQDPRVRELELQLAAERIANEFGIPAELFADAQKPEDIERITSEALLWRAETATPPPQPQTGAVSVSFASGVGVLGAVDRLNPRYQQVQTRDAVSRMTPAEILSAWRAGHLSQIGVGAPTANGSTPLTRRG